MKNLLAVIGVVIICFTNSVFGFDFGKRAQSFKILEIGFVKMMEEKLKTVDLATEEEKMKLIAKDRIENPIPVAGIKPATEEREFWYDPSYTLDKDAVLPCGKILHRAGTKVNPLEHMDLDRRLFFIDAREDEQIKWLKENLANIAKEEGSVIEDRIILVAGSIFKLQTELGQQVYFDQSGELTKKFGIKASPALAHQDGKRLKIKEVNLSNEHG